MLNRFLYSLHMGWRYRQQLAMILRQTPPNQGCIDVQPTDWLNKAKVWVLDFDGVLAAHGELKAHAEVEIWLDQCVDCWGAEQIFILSNKPIPARLHYFEQRYPSIHFVINVAKKPYPDGLQTISRQTGLAISQLVLLDDRLLTGILAACIAGAQAIYISRAYTNKSKRPIKEAFFALLRYLERQFLAYF